MTDLRPYRNDHINPEFMGFYENPETLIDTWWKISSSMFIKVTDTDLKHMLFLGISGGFSVSYLDRKIQTYRNSGFLCRPISDLLGTFVPNIYIGTDSEVKSIEVGSTWKHQGDTTTVLRVDRFVEAARDVVECRMYSSYYEETETRIERLESHSLPINHLLRYERGTQEDYDRIEQAYLAQNPDMPDPGPEPESSQDEPEPIKRTSALERLKWLISLPLLTS